MNIYYGNRRAHVPRGYGWLQVVLGAVAVAGSTLNAGDGLKMEGESTIAIASGGGGEFLLFDLEKTRWNFDSLL